MKKISTFLLVCGLFLGLSTTTFAQKYGHLNLGNLLSELSESKAANSELEALQQSLAKKSAVEKEAFQKKYLATLEDVQKGNLTPVQIQEKEKELEAERSKIAKNEEESVQKLQQKRQELLEPILNKVQEAVDAVAKENGYMMIFDTSVMNTVIFAEETDDIISLVKAKLASM